MSAPAPTRILSLILILLGAVLLFLAPDDTWLGIVLALAGIAVELLAFALRHWKNRQ